ncbi:M23 family metallopeptidase [bacterium]|nr:M23 family metallopeptidase [bacterium]
MPKKSWTILVVPHDEIRVRRLKISYWLVAAALTFSFTFLAGIGYLTVISLNKEYNHLKLINLQLENQLLTQKLTGVEQKISGLTQRISGLMDENQVFRRIAGLDLLDNEVREVGVGGAYIGNYDELFELNSQAARQIYQQQDQVDALLRKSDLIKQSLDDAIQSMQSSADKWSHHPSIIPTKGYISSFFGRREHPIYHNSQYHNAIDISTRMGESIIAPADGRVVMSKHQVGYGLTVVVDHGYGIVTKYAHLSKSNVRVGQEIKRGDLIAFVGQSGITTGPNLHYEVVVNGVPQNPLDFILDNYIP